MSDHLRARVTLADVARAAGVSTALVSIVMRGAPGAGEDTRERVLRIADDLGYVPDQRARKLRQASSMSLGVTFELREPFHGDLVEEIYRCAAAAGYDVVISAVAPSRPESVAVETVLSERCEAVLLLGSGLADADLADLAARLPTTVVARAVDDDRVGSVRGDDVEGVGLAVDHLVGLGHRLITHIDGGRAPGASDRRDGYRAAMARHGLAAVARIVDGGLTRADGAAAMREVLTSAVRPSAVVAFNDVCAAGVIDVALRAGISVPQDISVIGYDDARIAATAEVPMTTVSQDAAQLADDAVSGVLATLRGAAPVRVIRTPHLVVRETTASP